MKQEHQQTLDRIDKLIKKFAEPGCEEDLNIVFGWKDMFSDAVIVEDLSEHDGIKIVLREMKKEIGEINELLVSADSDMLPDRKRDRMIDRKDLYEKFIKVFEDSKYRINKIKEEVEENEEHLGIK